LEEQGYALGREEVEDECNDCSALVVSREYIAGRAAGSMARERERGMTLGKQTMWVGGWALAFALGAAASQAGGQTPQAKQQNVPNAPLPQTLPDLNTITPVAPALPAADSSAAAENGGTPGAALPGTPAPTAQATEEEQQGPPPASTASAADTLSVNVQFHQIPFTVKDSKNHLVYGLTWRDVRVYENGLRQQIRLFTVDPFPLAVALVIDQSVTYDTMEKINDSLAALQGAFTPYDEVAVFTYNNGVTKQTGFTAAQSARLGAILERSKGAGREPLMGLTGPLSHGSVINNMPIDGVTDPGHQPGSLQFTVPREFHTLNDAILAAAQAAAQASPDRRRVVYVISDGKEYGSKASQKEVIKYLLTNNVTVWATLVGDSAIKGMGFVDRLHLPLTMRDDVLPKYTAATGGQTDPEFRPRGIEDSFARITDEIRAQYTVGYYTHESPFNESYRSTEIRVLRPGLTIISKNGYYPSAADNARRPAPAPATPPAKP
jgi:VWFA-related protein